MSARIVGLKIQASCGDGVSAWRNALKGEAALPIGLRDPCHGCAERSILDGSTARYGSDANSFERRARAVAKDPRDFPALLNGNALEEKEKWSEDSEHGGG